MLIEIELFQVIITEGQPQQVIVLREKGGDRFFPIFIGFNEAMAIDRKLKDTQVPRPLTHDLLYNVIEKMGGKLARIVINDLKEDTYYALLEIRRGEEVIQVDSRPSDAIALAVRTSVPVFVAQHVLEHAALAGMNPLAQGQHVTICILKDGRRIKAKEMSDEGDEYAITDMNGKLITIKKSDIARIVEE